MTKKSVLGEVRQVLVAGFLQLQADVPLLQDRERAVVDDLEALVPLRRVPAGAEERGIGRRVDPADARVEDP